MNYLSRLQPVGLLALAVAISLIVMVNDLQGVDFSDRLYETLATRSHNEYVSVLVFMGEQLDVNATKAHYKLRDFSRQARHKLLLEELQMFAETEQVEFRGVLDRAIIGGEVRSYEAYWITNAFQIEATKSFIETLEERSDIVAVIEDIPPQSIGIPGSQRSQAKLADFGQGVSPGLRVVGADSMWDMGYTGEGSLVATFDTGVRGDHPALSPSWRGNNGYSSEESWFDPVFREDYPHYEPAGVGSPAHGTQTLGVIVGKDDSTGDTVGVAFGAQWISAMVVDVPGANYLEAFQWTADPDGDPNTIDDVPDVLNNSWGFLQNNISCIDIFWNAIDNLEALGTVVVFACGNEGPNEMTLRNPANRATTIYNSFSVGNVNAHISGTPIHFSSSRGPSDCDSISIKPEVVAPGVDIRTTSINLTAGYISNNVRGTSYAAPHVAGAVALLRQFNPNASVDTIKAALMNSAVDLGDTGEDNSYGRGLIDIPAALALMPANDEVNIYIRSVQHDPIDAGDTVEVVIELKNSGIGTIDVSCTLVNPDPAVTIIDASAGYGDLPLGGVADNSSTPYLIAFDSAIPDGDMRTVDLQISAGGGSYSKTIKVYFRVGELLENSLYTHYTDSVIFTISNYGVYGVGPNSYFNRGGLGFIYPATGVSNLFQCGLVIGTDDEHVSDAIVNLIGAIDQDFSVTVGGNLVAFTGGDLGDLETFSRFNDSYGTNPLNITIEQRTASYLTPPNTNYIILEYTIENSGDLPIANMRAGLYFDWDFPVGSYGTDRTDFARDLDLGYMWDHNNDQYRGTAVLNSEGVETFVAIPNSDIYPNGLSDAEKYAYLSAGTVDTALIFPSDQSYMIATGPFTLQPGESGTAAFAVLAATSLDQLRSIASIAKQVYRAATPAEDNDPPVLPTAFELQQNYPNPFNPQTTISFSLRKSGRVTLTIYNILGEEVALLMDQFQPAGFYSPRWDGTDKSGNSVASGVYFYRLTTEDYSEVRKMVLLK